MRDPAVTKFKVSPKFKPDKTRQVQEPIFINLIKYSKHRLEDIFIDIVECKFGLKFLAGSYSTETSAKTCMTFFPFQLLILTGAFNILKNIKIILWKIFDDIASSQINICLKMLNKLI